MKITILCNDSGHPINSYLEKWKAKRGGDHKVNIVRSKKELERGNLLFLVSCTEIINQKYRSLFDKTLVLHASDLPIGRGWSPHIWQIIEGKKEIVVSLIEAEDKVDTGRIWSKSGVTIPDTALWYEINDLIFETECNLMDFAVENFGIIQPQLQDPEIKPSYYPRRIPNDSRINPDLSLAEQFDLIRVCDPERFPAFFEFRGRKFKLMLERIDDES